MCTHEKLDFMQYVILTNYHKIILWHKNDISTPRFLSNTSRHLSSDIIKAMKRYPTSVGDWNPLCLFLVFQDTGELPRKTNYGERMISFNFLSRLWNSLSDLTEVNCQWILIANVGFSGMIITTISDMSVESWKNRFLKNNKMTLIPYEC